MKKIVMLMPHFGVWPAWIDIYLETCRHNPTVDWLFFTDCERPENQPPNVRFVRMRFREFQARAARKLAVDLPPHEVRKLCDYRPMFGLLFEDELSGYDFYGFGDVDVVYGDIRKHVTEAMLDAPDVLSFHTGMISGHFSLFRCCDRVKNLFRRIDGWSSQLRDPRHLRMDEDAFSEVLDADRTRYTEAFSTPSLYRKWKDGTWNFPTEWYWRDGQVTNDRDHEDYLYFHFLFWKGDTNPWGWRYRGETARIVHGHWREAPQGWRINADGFFPLDGPPVRTAGWRRGSRFIRARVRLEAARCNLKKELTRKWAKEHLWTRAAPDPRV